MIILHYYCVSNFMQVGLFVYYFVSNFMEVEIFQLFQLLLRKEERYMHIIVFFCNYN